MTGKHYLSVAIGAVLAATYVVAPAAAQHRKTACSKIMELCMKRAGDGHAAICEDMYSQARRTGEWPPTQEPNGQKHDAVPCTT